MDKELAWNLFKNTGNINAFLEYKHIQNIENGVVDVKKIIDKNNLENE